MDLDWVVAIVMFLVFLSWGFIYYSQFSVQAVDMESALVRVSDGVMDFLEVEVYNMPVRFYSENNTAGSILYSIYTWPKGSKNSTEVLSGGVSLPCMFLGDILYWQSALDIGYNYFLVEFSTVNTTLNCDSSLVLGEESQAIPDSIQKSKRVSQSKVDEMLGSDYQEFKSMLGIESDFRLEIENSSASGFGPKPPGNVNVYVRTHNAIVLESGDEITIRVLVW